MSVCFVKACGGGVIPIGRKAVGPTIVQFAAFYRHMLGRAGGGGRRMSSGGRGGGIGRRCDNTGVMCSVESCVAGGETPNAFLIAQLELSFEETERPFRGRT